MDAAYLKSNVMGALTEALTSMSIKCPDDQVEYLGNYLLAYVERKKKQQNFSLESKVVESSLILELNRQDEENKLKAEKALAKSQFDLRFAKFVESIPDYGTKSEALEAAANFIETDLGVPASYIAVKKPAGESETLNFVAAGPNQQNILGVKLNKPSGEEGDDAPERQGVLFETFKLPEVPEDAAADEGDEETKAAKPPPKPQPLIIENVMRDKRVKFFGMPKLGAFAAVPFSYQSIDHDGGCVLTPAAEPEQPPTFVLTKKDMQFLIAVDSVGKYRLFKGADIADIQRIGDGLVAAFEKIEAAMGAKQLKFYEDAKYKTMGEVVAALQAKLPEEEAKALADAATAIADPANAGEGVAEFYKPYKESELVLVQAWSPVLQDKAFVAAVNYLQNYVIPMPAAVLNLFLALGMLFDVDTSSLRDVCKDPSWDAIKRSLLPTLMEALRKFNPSASVTLSSADNKAAAIRAFCDASAVFDVANFPANLPIFALLSAWLQKALAAREASIIYHAEVKKVALENVA